MIQQKRELQAFDHFWLGAISKLVATTITYPYIVVKSRLQVQRSVIDASSLNKSVVPDKSIANDRYTSMQDAFLRILRSEGIHGFFKGIATKLIQVMLSQILLYRE